MRRALVAGNWKMYMTRVQAMELVRGLRKELEAGSCETEVVLAPPFTALETVAREIQGSGWALAAQNGFWEKEGAFTGEVSFPMLAELGCTMVILGHSERRHFFGEPDEWVRKKLEAALSFGLTPILCVGETLQQRDQGLTLEVVRTQLAEALAGLDKKEPQEFVVAYEPVWAIGTGRTATPSQAQEVHAMIRQWLKENFSSGLAGSTRILYGGSVKPDNIADLMACADIDGALVGGASLKAQSFAAIVRLGNN
ncbi:MAG: triose-phosphate isomerase [bacterium]